MRHHKVNQWWQEATTADLYALQYSAAQTSLNTGSQGRNHAT
jgi:hypothetical protein